MTASVLGALEPIKNYVETCISILYSLLKINIFWRPVDGTNTISISLTKPRFKKSIQTQTVTSVRVVTFYFRGKYHKLKYGTELNPEDLKPPVFDKKDGMFAVLLSLSFSWLLFLISFIFVLV